MQFNTNYDGKQMTLEFLILALLLPCVGYIVNQTIEFYKAKKK